MANKSVGAWLRQAIGGPGKGGKGRTGGPAVGMQVLTNEGTVLGTISAVWRGSEATDGATHEDTLGVHRPEGEDTGLLYIPSGAIAQVTDKVVTLTVDGPQVSARGWRFRPAWLRAEDPQREGQPG